MTPRFTDLSNLLEIEDDPRILDHRCDQTGIPLWTALRQPVFRKFGVGTLFEGNIVPSDYRLLADVADKAKALSRTAVHNARMGPGLNGRGEILISGTGAGLVLKDGKLFSRLSGHFQAAEADRTVVLEDLFAWRWPSPRDNRRILFRTPLQAASAARGRLFERRHSHAAENFVEFLGNRLRDILGLTVEPADRAWLVSLAARWLAVTPFEVAAYRKLLGRLGTRLLLREGGCYGHSAPMIWAAKSMGIATAEYQHGLVTRNHDAYNFAETIRSSARYRETLPDTMLSFGSWWTDQINAPLGAVSVGNPHRSERLKTWRAGIRDTILVVGDGHDRDAYRSFCRELRQRLPDTFVVTFRPHPQDRRHFVDMAYRQSWQGITLDGEGDVYTSFENAFALIGEASTVLFEAVGLVDRIVVLDTPKSRFSLPGHPFPTVTSASDLAALVTLGVQDVASIDEASIWETDWKRRYRDFLRSVTL